MGTRRTSGMLLLLFAVVPHLDFYGRALERMKAEELLLQQLWSAVSVVCTIAGLMLIFWPRRWG